MLNLNLCSPQTFRRLYASPHFIRSTNKGFKTYYDLPKVPTYLNKDNLAITFLRLWTLSRFIQSFHLKILNIKSSISLIKFSFHPGLLTFCKFPILITFRDCIRNISIASDTHNELVVL